jgi:hypothetical protein
MIEEILYNNVIIAIIVYSTYHNEGVKFLTPRESQLQVGYISHPAGYEIMPHTHNPVHRDAIGTHEVLMIRSGSVLIDFYSFEQKYLESRELHEGDIIMLVGAGHGITMLEPTVMVEVKNGPYIAEADKDRFQGRKATLDAARQSATTERPRKRAVA